MIPCREALPLLNDDTVYSKGLLSLDLKVRDTNSLLAAALGISGLSMCNVSDIQLFR